MYKARRIISLLLTIALLTAIAPLTAMADEIYSISNGYLTYSYNAETGGFSIETAEGNPQKSYDDNIPLLYTEDSSRSNSTSFTTVRIDGNDYIFGQDYGFFGLSTKTAAPVISEGGRLLTMEWTIKGITVKQQIALGTDENTDTIGNAGISYEVVNNSGAEAEVSIRLMLDTALGKDIDAPYILSSGSNTPLYVETEYSGDEVPDQIRGVDSVSSPKAMSYIIPKGWEGGTEPNKIIVGHWANLANTRYDYTVDKYCDFTNYSNAYRTPDAAVAIYWDSQTVAAGGSFSAETLYGVGNFSGDTGDRVGINVTADRVNLNSAGDGYENDGEITATIEIDNTLDNSVDLTSISMVISTDEECFTVVSDDTLTYDGLSAGDIISETIKLKALPQTGITAGTVYISLTSWATIDGILQIVETMTQRSIVIPSVSGNKATVSMTAVNPDTVYTDGEKAVTINGDMKAFKSLNSDSGWSLKLKHTTSDHEVVIDKKNVAFLDDSYTTMSFSTTDDLYVGAYNIVFEFSDETYISSFGKSVTASAVLNVSADKIYALKSYAILSLVRTTDSNNNTTYDFFSFAGEGEYQQFYDGEISKTGLVNGTKIQHYFGETKSAIKSHEILLTVRGRIREMEDENQNKYWQADYADGDITINNMLSYEGSEPLQMYADGGSYAVEGDGLLKVVNSINVWRSEWSFSVMDGIVYTLNPERTGSLVGAVNQLTLALGGAATMIQSIGGFLIDLSYGVMSSEWYDDGDGNITYGISFGGTISIPISSKSESKDTDETAAADTILTADDDSDEEDYSEALQNLFREDDDDDKTTTGTTNNTDSTTSTTTTTNQATGDTDSTKTKKKTGLSDAQLSAEVDEVLFGEDGKVVVEDTGFIGIDATLSLELPEDVLGSFISNSPGLYVSMTINTINNIYELDMGISIKIIECEAVLGFKQVSVSGNDTVVPNRIGFYIKEGLMVPLVTPVLYMTGLGGEINNLADTIGGNFTSLPPVTLTLFMGLTAIKLLDGDFYATVSLSGLSIDGELTISGNEQILLMTAGISAQWVTPWNLSLYGTVDIIDGLITGGISVTIAQDYFYGYIYAALCIPNSIPVVGGMQLAAVEAAVSDEFVGANVKILKIKYGFIYYWGGSFSMSNSIDLSPDANMLSLMAAAEENEVTAEYGTNITKLSTKKVTSKKSSGISLMANTSETSVSVSGTDNSSALLIEVKYTGDGTPTADEVTLTNPSGTVITMEPNDNNGGGNFLTQDLGSSGKFIYMTVTDSDLIKNGTWTVTSTADDVTLGDMVMNDVANIPELSSTSVTYDEKNPFDLTVDWTVDSTRLSEGTLDVYLTDDPNVLEELKNYENDRTTLGYNIEHTELDTIKGGSIDIEIPEGFASGKYYVVTTLSQKDGISTAISSNAINFTNPNLPKAVEGINVKYGGNGNLYVDPVDPADADYTDYLVEINPVDTEETLENNFNQYSVDEGSIYIGEEAGLKAGSKYTVSIKTLREESKVSAETGNVETVYYYGTEIVTSDEFTMPEVSKPVLTNVETDFNMDEKNINTDSVTITYTFDRPVWMMLSSRGQSVYHLDGDFKESWTFTLDELEDGDYVVDFTAYSTSKDYVTGADFADETADNYVKGAQIGFTVDTSAPVLNISMTDASDVDGNAALAAANVVTAAADGSYTISGLTEKSAEITVDGSGDNITIDLAGGFTYSGKLAEGETETQHIIKAVDKAGNTSELMVYVVSDMGDIESIELLADGAAIPLDADGIPTVSLDINDISELTVLANMSDGSTMSIAGEDIEWHVLYEKNIITLDDGTVTALADGETAVRAKLPTAVVTTADDDEETVGFETYAIINIASVEETPSPTETPAPTEPAEPTATTKPSSGGGGGGGSTRYTVTFNSNGGSDVSSSTVSKNSTVSEPTAPTKDGYEFAGWYTDSALTTEYDFSTKVTSSFTLYAKWTEIENGDGDGDNEHNCPSEKFTDVDISLWYHESIDYALDNNLMYGTSDTTFEPDTTTTRGMIVTILHRLEDESEAEGDSIFTDVAAGEWYTEAVTWAAENNIVAGYGDGTFGPNDTITREQTAAILHRYAQYKGYDVSAGENTNILSFKDAESVSEYAVPSVQWAVGTGLVSGRDDGTLDPLGGAMRAEAAAMLMRFIEINK
ncbi:MAG: S-layer homology domain-containing protein [Oscillospiraceae bacterium]|nr:S-layer homology domain-containing protein [Oscillospiraceae bacterium]